LFKKKKQQQERPVKFGPVGHVQSLNQIARLVAIDSITTGCVACSSTMKETTRAAKVVTRTQNALTFCVQQTKRNHQHKAASKFDSNVQRPRTCLAETVDNVLQDAPNKATLWQLQLGGGRRWLVSMKMIQNHV
jgi:hypothetical protein